MANNYVLFSEAIEDLTKEEMCWWMELLDEIESAVEDEIPLDKGLYKIFEGSGCVDFQWSIDDNCVYFFSEESGDPEQVMLLVQLFLHKFRPDEKFSMQWAFTCSKSRPGQFGGGAAVATKKGIKYLDVGRWVQDQLEES
jgi:hypothetical protein